jgi:AcrR family transcriptional regulator
MAGYSRTMHDTDPARPALPDAPGGSGDAPTVRAPRAGYHHGDLRAALLVAAEQELAEQGIEAFSLRGVARRAGVSHAAPAHHFGDVSGLLTALAAEGFRRFLACQDARQATAGPSPRARMLADGLGYIDFALQHPALFRLVFASARPDYADRDLGAVAGLAYARLEAGVQAVARAEGRTATPPDVAATWAIVHGLAELMGSGRLFAPGGSLPADLDAFAVAIIDRCLPTPG